MWLIAKWALSNDKQCDEVTSSWQRPIIWTKSTGFLAVPCHISDQWCWWRLPLESFGPVFESPPHLTLEQLCILLEISKKHCNPILVAMAIGIVLSPLSSAQLRDSLANFELRSYPWAVMSAWLTPVNHWAMVSRILWEPYIYIFWKKTTERQPLGLIDGLK